MRLSKQMEKPDQNTWIEISKSALINNVQIFKKLIKPETRLLAVVKSNAYGHGIVGASKAFVEGGADWLGVFSFDEAMLLRKNGINIPILVLGPTDPYFYGEAVDKNVSITISQENKLSDLIPGLKIHLKIETGLSRQGFFPAELKNAIERINDKIKIEGIYTHLADPHDVDDISYTEKQFNLFKQAIEILKSSAPANAKNVIKHMVATDGLLTFPQGELDMVRIGIGLYGIPIDTKWEAKFRELNLAPALVWKTKISEIKEIDMNTPVGYGRTEIVQRKSKIAVLPVGYWDGYPRSLSSKGFVEINSNYCKIIGIICMNMMMVDVTDLDNVKCGDQCILMNGKSGKVFIANIAQNANSISYEVVTRINPLIFRIFK
jgi:alanine racemase